MNKKFFFPLSSTAILFFLFFFIDPALANNDFSQLDYSETLPTNNATTQIYISLSEPKYLNNFSIKCKTVCVGDDTECNKQVGYIYDTGYIIIDQQFDYALESESYTLDEIRDYTFNIGQLLTSGTYGVGVDNNNALPPIRCQAMGNADGDPYILFDWQDTPNTVDPAVDFPYQDDIHFISGMVEYYSSTTGTTTPFQTAKYYFQIPFLLYAFIVSIVIMIFFPLFVIAKFYK